jgi:hypothetical protein
VRSLVCVLTSSVVEVAGVVEGVEPTWEEFRVEADTWWVKVLPLCPS